MRWERRFISLPSPQEELWYFPDSRFPKPYSVNAAGFGMWDRMTAHCVLLTSALGNQIPTHHFSSFIKECKPERKGKEKERNLAFGSPFATITVRAALSLADQRAIPRMSICLTQGGPWQTCSIKSKWEHTSNLCSEPVCPNSW